MAFERVYSFCTTVEKCFLYPVIIITALTVSTPVLLAKHGLVAATAIETIIGVFMFRRCLGEGFFR
jgi:hypothetical protein